MIDDELLWSVFRGRRGLPSAAFVDERWFDHEVDAVLARTWSCIGFDHDAPSAGDVVPLTFAGRPLVLVRDDDGRLRVFHNVCSHRGATLVGGTAGGLRTLACPYHRWVYGLDGRLRHTHHAGGYRVHVTPEVDLAELGLREVRSATWHGHVFVDLTGDAAPFEDHIAPVAARLAPVDWGLLRHDPIGDQRVDVQANWKAIIENFVESYHVPAVHPALQRCNPMATRFQILGGASYVGQGGLTYGAEDNPDPMPGAGLPLMPSLVAQDFSYESLWIFPNLIVAPLPNMTYSLLLLPVGAARTVERLCFSFNGDEAMAPQHEQGRADAVAALVQVNTEDVAIVESCQRGRRSPAFTGGVFLTQQEATSLLVQRNVAGRVLRDRGEAPDLATLPVGDIHHARPAG